MWSSSTTAPSSPRTSIVPPSMHVIRHAATRDTVAVGGASGCTPRARRSRAGMSVGGRRARGGGRAGAVLPTRTSLRSRGGVCAMSSGGTPRTTRARPETSIAASVCLSSSTSWPRPARRVDRRGGCAARSVKMTTSTAVPTGWQPWRSERGPGLIALAIDSIVYRGGARAGGGAAARRAGWHAQPRRSPRAQSVTGARRRCGAVARRHCARSSRESAARSARSDLGPSSASEQVVPAQRPQADQLG